MLRTGTLAFLLFAFSQTSWSASHNLGYMSQCDGCDSRQLKKQILDQNQVQLEQKWYSLDGPSGRVTALRVNYFPEDPGSWMPTQRRGNRWYYLEDIANDGMIDQATTPLLRFYRLAPTGWSKSFGPTPGSLAHKILNPTALSAEVPSDTPTLPPYPDSQANVWNTIDPGSAYHNVIVNYVQNSTVGKIQQARGALSDFFGGISSLSSKGVTISVSPGVQASMYVVVSFQDGSKLSLAYTKDGWVTDPRFGKSTDSNGNSVPVSADQIGPPGGLHVYDFLPKSWATNPYDRQSWGHRGNLLTGGSIVIDTRASVLACTSISGQSPVCQNFLTP